ncbi:DUF3506 domain-containing protein, partial [Haematococcus lacustris]
VYGPHGAEVISVTYDFSSAAARINAVKVTGDNNVPAAAAGSEPEGGAHPRLPKVVACHLGQARIAGLNYSNPQWVPGRLWEYEGGGLAFMYCWPGSEEEPMFCVTFTRLP